MSYDVSVTCPHCRQETGEWNYTSNLSGAWDEAGARLRDWDGQLAADCAPLLAAAIERIEVDRAGYAARHNPDNGWGSIDTLIPALRRLHDIMHTAPPGAVVRICL